MALTENKWTDKCFQLISKPPESKCKLGKTWIIVKIILLFSFFSWIVLVNSLEWIHINLNSQPIILLTLHSILSRINITNLLHPYKFLTRSMVKNNVQMMLNFYLFSSLSKIVEIICTEISFIKIEVEQLKVEILWSLIQLKLPFGLNISVDMMKAKKSTWRNKSNKLRLIFKELLVLKLVNHNSKTKWNLYLKS